MILNQRRLDNAFSSPIIDQSVSVAPFASGLQQPSEPFQWGAGGARLTPEQIMAREEIARKQMQSDFSPVGHWTQGLGRVAENIMGALDAKALDKESKAANADRTAMIAQMLGPDNADLAGAVSSGDKILASLAGDIMERRNPFEFEARLSAEGLTPGTPEYQAALRQERLTRGDPFITANLPNGDFYAGPQSGFAQLLKGGDPQISPSPGPVGSPAPASAGPGVPHLTVDQMGAFGSMFPQWQKREGTPVLVTSPEEMARVPAGTMVISPDGRRGVKK